MNYSGASNGTSIYIGSDSISYVYINELVKPCSVVDENDNDKQHLLCSTKAVPAVLTEKSSNEGLESNSEGSNSGLYLVTPYSKLNDTSVSNSPGFRIEWEENPSEKKNVSNKKHTNTTPLTDKSKGRGIQKRRRKRFSLFNTEERFEDKMPYICFECKKMFGYYSSLDEHENSHALNKVWYA